MDEYRNPFNPGAGVRPPELAGRADVLQQAITALERVKRGRHAKSLMILGLRGVGKTVLLNQIAQEAESKGYLAETVEARDGEDLRQMLQQVMRRVLLKLDRGEQAVEAVKKGLLKKATVSRHKSALAKVAKAAGVKLEKKAAKPATSTKKTPAKKPAAKTTAKKTVAKTA